MAGFNITIGCMGGPMLLFTAPSISVLLNSVSLTVLSRIEAAFSYKKNHVTFSN